MLFWFSVYIQNIPNILKYNVAIHINTMYTYKHHFLCLRIFHHINARMYLSQKNINRFSLFKREREREKYFPHCHIKTDSMGAIDNFLFFCNLFFCTCFFHIIFYFLFLYTFIHLLSSPDASNNKRERV